MTRTAIIAAMPDELKPLVRGWAHQRRGHVHLWRWTFDGGEWVAACGGAGAEAGTRAFAEIEHDGAIDRAISAGWVGALRAHHTPGHAYPVAGVIDARTGERFSVSGNPDGCWVVTSPRVADAQEKLRLATTYNADLVDMEGAIVARLAAMRGIPFHCVKAVSDGLNARLPDFNPFITADGQFKMARFVVFALLRPWHWPALAQMGENSSKASQSIAKSLLENLDPQGTIRQRNGYPNIKR
ncbi:MAG: nucleoside phosphorylase [Terracidiphilus sp.]|jgi:adenosylhomocysteine nucleosidase